MESKGRKDNQKMKPYLVYQYLLKKSDENNEISAPEICAYLEEELKIKAERRSIYRDIDAINKAIWMLQNYSDMEEAENIIDNDRYDQEKPIVYDPSKKGFYVRNRGYEFEDIRLIAECIYSSRYISERKAKELVDIMKDFLSENQSEKIRTDAIVPNRLRVLNDSLLDNVSRINDAMSLKLYGNNHIPEKISFQYLRTDINNLNNQIERLQGKKYIISPYKLIINDGNYYLLAFDDDSKEIRTYRVDRMKSIKLLGIEREGKEEFEKIDLSNYMQRTFSMFSGEKTRIKMQFINSLLDTVLEKFGREKVYYQKIDEHHFTVEATIEISNQFYGWLCGFGNNAKIISPESTKAEFINYINSMLKNY